MKNVFEGRVNLDQTGYTFTDRYQHHLRVMQGSSDLVILNKSSAKQLLLELQQYLHDMGDDDDK